ncbi:MAG TPA: hypothetical protein VJB93_00160, partial [Patescibacteria group bacterium]|nr:hypothetical protein [Patescibacteria group bacterium]
GILQHETKAWGLWDEQNDAESEDCDNLIRILTPKLSPQGNFISATVHFLTFSLVQCLIISTTQTGKNSNEYSLPESSWLVKTS